MVVGFKTYIFSNLQSVYDFLGEARGVTCEIRIMTLPVEVQQTPIAKDV